MKSNLKASLMLTAAICVGAMTPVKAQETKSPSQQDRVVMERVMVIGSAEAAKDIAGSAHFIDQEQLDNYNYTDINRVLRAVPGVNIQEEEGYGNRPNIGLRGGRSERSADVTLMEDGILIAPAPYASPSAYFFPRVSRMESIEVRKGSSTIKFGPRTTSGAINMISSSVPESQDIKAIASYGTDNSQFYQGHYGDSTENFGFVFDVTRESTDGFKTIDIVGGDTGYQIEDIMGKIRFNTSPEAEIYQSIELKFGATNEESDETYLGLSEADFKADPYRRYAATQEDEMQADHRQYHIRHFIDFGSFDATTTVYHNKFSRNWYKLQDLTVGGVTEDLNDALTNATFLDALNGTTDLAGDANDNLRLRTNNRNYYSTGIQTDLSTQFDWDDTTHMLEFGLRYHYDKEDRFQHQDLYAITNGVMELTTGGTPGSQANRHATATATSVYVLDEITSGPWTFVPGVRYEYVETRREDFNASEIRENTVDEVLPGMGIAYDFSDNFQVFGGVHKGFAPASPSSTTDDNEESINYEIGTRYTTGDLSTELIGYFNDYSNLLGECTISSGCTGGSIGDQFNAGEVDAYGIEFVASYDAAEVLGLNGLSVPIVFNYTYTQAEFQNSFVSSFDEWGNVTAGDELPYIPEHQFFVEAGVVDDTWEFRAAGKYTGEMRTVAGSGDIPPATGTDETFIVDVAAEYEFLTETRGFVNVFNLFDTEYVAARRPAGARPGRPLTFIAGVKYQF